jgi:RHS repeat-associated protein
VENFQVNSVNELTANTNGGTLTVMGATTSPASSVAVNGTGAALYGDSTFAAAGLSLTTTYTATASDSNGRHSTNTVTVSIAANTTFQYDGNGNLTNDGLRSFAYDDENQLTQVSVANQWLSMFQYDGKMRRRIRKEFTWDSGLSSWRQTNEVYYVYDGNLVIQERDLNNLPTVTYTRGIDLSGSLEGAGGIGGLLSRTSQQYTEGSLSGHSFYHSDANGNITMLIDSTQGIVAKYLYDAFGNIISKAGLLADANVYRSSSKEWHSNSGLIYYLYRYYDPNLQRWLNRDPLVDFGIVNYVMSSKYRTPKNLFGRNHFFRMLQQFNGKSLYDFVDNSPINELDRYGLCPCDTDACNEATETFSAAYVGMVLGCGTGNLVTCVGVTFAALVAEKQMERHCAGCPPPGGTGLIPGLPVSVPPRGPPTA